MLLEQRKDVVGRRLAGEDAGRADVDRRPEEHVELRAVIERERVEQAVAAGDLALDDAAHVLPEHCLVRQHRAFGQALGAAGVDDLRQRTRVDRRLDGPRLGREQRVEGQHSFGSAGRDVLAGQPDEALDLGVARRCLPAELDQVGPDREETRPGVAQDEAGLLGVEHEVDRHQDRAEPRQREPKRGERVRVAREDREAVAGLDAHSGKAGRHAIAGCVEFGEGPAHASADDCGLARSPRRAAVEDVAQGLPPDIFHVDLRRQHAKSGALRRPRPHPREWCLAKPPWMWPNVNEAIGGGSS